MKLTKQEFTQDMHCCGSADQDAKLAIEIHDGGAGGYLVMHALHWSFDGADDIRALADRLMAMQAEIDAREKK